MPLKVQPGILEINPYVGGKSKISGKNEVIKLSSNENALGTSPKAIEAYQLESDNLFRYSDGNSTLLRETIGQVYNLDPARIVCGCGSDEIIGLLCKAYAGLDDEVLQTEYGFLMYAIYAKSVGAKVVMAPEKNYRVDIDALLDNVSDKTRIVFIANPNNPTGSYIPTTDIKRLRDNLPEHILLVVDAAYAEYVSKEDYDAGISLVNAYDNVVMIRTFSKIYGLPSLRLGWCYAPQAIADVLNRVRGPFNVAGAAQAAGAAAILDKEFTETSRVFNEEQLAYLTQNINSLGYEALPSVTNFILVKFPDGEEQAQAIYKYLQENGIIVRAVANYNLPYCLRVTVGTAEENRILIETLRNYNS